MKPTYRKKLLGTLFDEDEILNKQNFYNIKAKDDKDKVRWTGAFTGGFTAGYHNTVGSKEGWNPTQFKSSRKDKSKIINQNIEDFMDEEDLESLQINKNFTKSDELRTIEEINVFGKETLAIKKDTTNFNIMKIYIKNAKRNYIVDKDNMSQNNYVNRQNDDLPGIGSTKREENKNTVESQLLRKRRYLDTKTRVTNFDFENNYDEDNFDNKVLNVNKQIKKDHDSSYRSIAEEFIEKESEKIKQLWIHFPNEGCTKNIMQEIVNKNLALSRKNDKTKLTKKAISSDNGDTVLSGYTKLNSKFVQSETKTNEDYGLVGIKHKNDEETSDNVVKRVRKTVLKKGDIVTRQIKKIKLSDLVFKRFEIKPKYEEDFTSIVKNKVHTKEENNNIQDLSHKTEKINIFNKNKDLYKEIFDK